MAYSNTDYTDSKYREYQKKLLALVPINTNEKSKAYRALWREYYGWNKKSVKELDLN